jgi:hypothetical protein
MSSTTTSTTLNPGTLFRIQATERTHYTAVLLKDGKVLEVKNPDTNNQKQTYDSFALWCQAHNTAQESVIIDSSKGKSAALKTDSNGFKYQLPKRSAYRWINWVYSIVEECAPELFNSEEFKTAFNRMVDITTKHKSELSHWHYHFRPTQRYQKDKLGWLKEDTYQKWRGYTGDFGRESNREWHLRQNPTLQIYTRDEFVKAREEILVAYKAILDIIAPILKPIFDARKRATDLERWTQSNSSL